MCKRSLLLSLLLWAPSAAAQDGEPPPSFTSDRPGFANTTGIAARGHLTTELGVQAMIDESSTLGELPRLSLRAGVFEWLELRLMAPNAVGVFDGSGASFGLGDPWLGFKIGGQVHETVAISSVWQVSVPLGTDGYGAPEAQWFADFNLDWNFWGPLTLTPNAVASVVVGTDESTGRATRHFDGGGSLKFTWQVIDTVGIYVQSYVLKGEVTDWRVQVGGGVTWMVAPNVQVDLNFDTGVTSGSDQPPTVGAGTSILW